MVAGEKLTSGDPWYLLTEGETIGLSAGSWFSGEPDSAFCIYATDMWQNGVIYLMRDLGCSSSYRHICQYNSHP